MKRITLSFVSIMMLASSGVFGQSDEAAPGHTSSGWQPVQSAKLSREQVYQQLVASRDDGSLARINKLYAHH